MILRIAHILLEQRFEAEDVLRKLKLGESFEDLARKFSRCSSARMGGDLGAMELRKLDPTFAEAAEKLAPGQISDPIRTRFGFHIIQRRE